MHCIRFRSSQFTSKPQKSAFIFPKMPHLLKHFMDNQSREKHQNIALGIMFILQVQKAVTGKPLLPFDYVAFLGSINIITKFTYQFYVFFVLFAQTFPRIW